jgi:hypothetical protein
MPHIEYDKIIRSADGCMGTCKLGTYHVGEVGIMNSLGTMSTKLFGVISYAKELIAHGCPSIDAAWKFAEQHYASTLLSATTYVVDDVELAKAKSV